MLQQTALNILKSGKNVFLTGSAGTGKTYLLNQYIKLLRQHQVPLAITASTGIAATHIGGQTIHSWSGLGIKDSITKRDLEKIRKRSAVKKRLRNVKVLIIDEISMLSGQNIENINLILQHFKENFLPFGGIQVIFSGDFFQLPPVSRERLPNYEKFAFMAPIWRQLNLHICYLTEQFRQSDDDLANFLNEIRSGEVSDSGFDQLRECLERSQEPADFSTKLFTHNADVDAINAQELDKLEARQEKFWATTSGSQTLVDALKKSILAPEILTLKEGAQVMFVKNNVEGLYMNGTLGTITGFSNEGWPVVTTQQNKKIVARPDEWTVHNEFGKPLATFKQIPLRLAWAITVHKSQGMTLDQAEMNLSKTFESGQGYVALSRVKSWSGLRVTGCNQTALQLDPLALKADQRFQELSQEIEESVLMQSEQETKDLFQKFIRKSGGSLTPISLENESFKIIPEKKDKRSTYEKTKELITAGKTLPEIVQKRGISEDTIIEHLHKLTAADPDLDLSAMKPKARVLKEIEMGFRLVHQRGNKDDFDQLGRVRLRPVFDVLEEKYFYRDLKIARLFIDL